MGHRVAIGRTSVRCWQSCSPAQRATLVTMPWLVSHPAAPGGLAPDENGGWLGAGRDPFVLTSNPNSPGFSVAGFGASAEDVFASLHRREALLHQLDSQACGITDLSRLQEKAFSLLTSPKAQRAFDIAQEPPQVRDRYGRHIHGQCLLLAPPPHRSRRSSGHGQLASGPSHFGTRTATTSTA